jgi:hypothetical protein
MKKIFNSIMMLALSLVAFTACDTDRDDNPVLGPGNMPTEFVLNESPLSNQFIYISKDNNLKLSWSQPNYPINTVVNYMVQVGLVQGGSIKWNEEGGQPQFLETSVTTCTATLSGEEISQAINHNDGITDENNWVDPGYREIAFRVCANIQTTTKVEVEGTRIFSNAVTFKKMRPDNSVKGLASLYVIGNCSGWTEPAKGNAEALAAWRIMETEIGSKIFHGVIDMPDYSGDALTFRFYTKLTGWDGSDGQPTDSYGWQVDDNSKEFEFKDGVFEGDGVAHGKGSWSFANNPGGQLDLTED